MKQLCYDMWSAQVNYNVNTHPQQHMKDLGFILINSVPQSIADCWWFTVEDFDFDLPPYLSYMEYNFDYWSGECTKDCEYFKKSFDSATQTHYPEYSCWGGRRCLKVKENDNN